MFRTLRNVVKTKKYFRNLSDDKKPEFKLNNFENKNFNSKFEFEYIQRLESIEDGLRKGIFYIGLMIMTSGYLIHDSIKRSTYREINLRYFYGLKGISDAIEKTNSILKD